MLGAKVAILAELEGEQLLDDVEDTAHHEPDDAMEGGHPTPRAMGIAALEQGDQELAKAGQEHVFCSEARAGGGGCGVRGGMAGCGGARRAYGRG